MPVAPDDIFVERIRRNIARADAQRMRALFAEMNPHLLADARFERRWSEQRQEAAVLVPIIARPEGASVLFTVRSSDMPSHAGQISFPGGRRHAEDPDAVATALREAEEEVNIPRASVSVLGALGVHYGGLGFAVTPVVGLVDPGAPIRACPREVAEIFEAPLAWFADLSNHVVEERFEAGERYRIFAAPYRDYHIWGLTAGILRTLADVLAAEDEL